MKYNLYEIEFFNGDIIEQYALGERKAKIVAMAYQINRGREEKIKSIYKLNN